MCGIIGIIGKREAAPLLLDALKRLEYRGYDSAGLASVVNGSLDRRRAEGKLVNLEKVLEKNPLPGRTGIGHTRWATHGVPSENNAHPHMTKAVAIVHNGIIENYLDLRAELDGTGVVYESQTDTEVVAHLISREMAAGLTPEEAVAKTLPKLEGAFAFVMAFAGRPDLLIGARRGSPLAIGYGEGEMYFGSDALAMASLTRRICYLEEGDWAILSPEGARLFDTEGNAIDRPIVESTASAARISRGNFPHFMLKEIYEQPGVIGDTLATVLNPAEQTITIKDLSIDLAQVDRITLSACGTAFYAGMVAKYWFEQLAGVPVETDIASELRYRDPPLPGKGGMGLFISQSGETMDTLEALRLLKKRGQQILSIVNVPGSTIARESHAVIPTLAGPEIGVASTKAFTTQLTALACLAIAMAKAKGRLDRKREAALASALIEVPGRAVEVLNHDDKLAEIAGEIAKARDVLYLGRGISYPIALEGALKLKEISYIHAEGYAAGEMKHGPIALIDSNVPIIVIAPSDNLFEKTASNVQEAVARGGKVIFLSDAAGLKRISAMTQPFATVELPKVDSLVAPILYAMPVQLLAYHTAVLKGTDVDQPRNLAKSVTVE